MAQYSYRVRLKRNVIMVLHVLHQMVIFFLYHKPLILRQAKGNREISVAAGALPTRAAHVLEIIPVVLPSALITTRRLIRIVQLVGGGGGRESGQTRKNLKTVIGLLEHPRL